jgi:hypothetical protein
LGHAGKERGSGLCALDRSSYAPLNVGDEAVRSGASTRIVADSFYRAANSSGISDGAFSTATTYPLMT